MGLLDYLLLGLIALAVLLALRRLRRSRKKGCGCGCSCEACCSPCDKKNSSVGH